MHILKIGGLVCVSNKKLLHEILEIDSNMFAYIQAPGESPYWEDIRNLRSIWDDNPDTDGMESFY